MPQNELVRLIYEAIDEPALCDQFLSKFADSMHAEAAGLMTQDRAGGWARITATVGMDAASRKSYEEYFVSRNPWLPLRTMFVGNVEIGEQLLSNRELVKTEFYQDFLAPNHWFHGCSGLTNVKKSEFSCIYSLHSAGDGVFTSDEIGLCRYLAPHLNTAARIKQRIADLKASLDRLLFGEIDTEALAELGLTPAETRLAIALFKGQSVDAYADEAAISINTARWHVKQIYAKTGVKRQTELIHLLLKKTARI
jgi:DNA-binding CsgD family transcriptional regulator